MAFDLESERAAVVGVAVPGASLGAWPSAILSTFWRWAAANSYFPSGAPPPPGSGGIGDDVRVSSMSGYPRGTTQLGG